MDTTKVTATWQTLRSRASSSAPGELRAVARWLALRGRVTNVACVAYVARVARVARTLASAPRRRGALRSTPMLDLVDYAELDDASLERVAGGAPCLSGELVGYSNTMK
ncbi:MAG: hypothetical protein ABI601_06085 [bacterium]